MIDFMIVEAISARVNKEELDLQKKKKVADWKHDKEGLDNLRHIAAGG